MALTSDSACCSDRLQHPAEEPGGHERSGQSQCFPEGSGYQHHETRRCLGSGDPAPDIINCCFSHGVFSHELSEVNTDISIRHSKAASFLFILQNLPDTDQQSPVIWTCISRRSTLFAEKAYTPNRRPASVRRLCSTAIHVGHASPGRKF